MGPENPPRRSKSDQEPLTIDLEANRTATEKPETAVVDARASSMSTEIRAAKPMKPCAPIFPNRQDFRRIPSPKPEEEDARAEAAAAAFAEEPTSAATPAETPRPTTRRPRRTVVQFRRPCRRHSRRPDHASRRRRPAICRRPALARRRTAADTAIEQSLASDIEAIKAQLAAAPAPRPPSISARSKPASPSLKRQTAEAGNGAADRCLRPRCPDRPT